MDASGFGSFDVPGISAFDKLAVELSIDSITDDSGADRLVASGPLSCVGRYWILAKQVSK